MDWQGRLQKLRSKFSEYEIDGLLVSQPENRRYLSGFHGTAGYLIISSTKAILATDFRYTEQARNQATEFEVVQIGGHAGSWLADILSGMDIKLLGFESEDMTFSAYRTLTEAIKELNVKFVPVKSLVEFLRQVKEPEELELIVKAATITDRAYKHIAEKIKPGMTETGLAWEIERFIRESGSETLPFEAIVASGPNAALPHAHPGERTINKGESVVIDIGAKCGGYASDMTRTFYIGEEDSTFKKVYDTVLGAQAAAITLIKEGMTGEEADKLARIVIEEAGYGQNFGHGLGHGVGLVTHEMPRLGSNSKDILLNGTVFTIEPGVYLSGWGGVRIEDMAVMENGRPRVITFAPKTK